MSATTFSKRRVALIGMVAGALTVLVPVGQADPGDAFMRALENRQTAPSFIGSPDAIDRALAAKERSKVAAIDARERGLTERTSIGTTHGPDAFERAVSRRSDGTHPRPAHLIDGRVGVLVERPPSASPVAAGDGGFDWSDFGLGAGTGMGFVLVALGIGIGVLAVRRGQGRLTNL